MGGGRRVGLFLIVLLLSQFCFSKETIDSIIPKIAKDITSRLDQGSILCILDFSISSDLTKSQDMAKFIQNNLTDEVMDAGNVDVVTRANMDKINEELKFQSSGVVSDETAVSICERVGANFIVFGELTNLENKYELAVKMLTVEKGTYKLSRSYKFFRSAKSEQLMGFSPNRSKVSLGLALGFNKDSLSAVALSGGLKLEFNPGRKVSLGIKALVSSDIANKENSVYIFDPTAFLKFYLVNPSGEPSTGLFLAFDIGASVIFVDSEIRACVNGGGEIGYRQELGIFYIEPAARFGYPYMFAFDVGFGVRF